MDGNRFDDLTRRLAAGASRRSVITGAAAALLGALGVREAASQATQASCGNMTCRSNPGVCRPGCVCCVYANGNSRCRPPGTCGGGTEVVPTTTPAPTTPPPTTTAAPTTAAPTTAPPPTTTATPTTTAPPVCLAVRSVCNPSAPTCCQDVPTQCDFEANCTTAQGEARCCRPLGQACSARCDCCGNADCVQGVCGLGEGQQCLESSECASGSCCNGICRDLSTDLNNCGACGVRCASGSSCAAGVCRCPANAPTVCNGVCVDTSADNSNCGNCGVGCNNGATCSNSVCRTCDGASCTARADCCDGFVCNSEGKCETCAPGGTTLLETDPDICCGQKTCEYAEPNDLCVCVNSCSDINDCQEGTGQICVGGYCKCGVGYRLRFDGTCVCDRAACVEDRQCCGGYVCENNACRAV